VSPLRRAVLVVALVLVMHWVVLLPPDARAQSGEKIPTLGLLWFAASIRPSLTQALRDGLRERGWVEGRTIRIVERFADGKPERLRMLAAELVALKVDVIVTGGTTSIRAARNATSTIPIVSAATADPVEMGFAASLARPGGNVTGLSILGPELLSKQLELLKQTVPQATMVAVLLHAANPGNPAFVKAMQEAAPRLKIRILPFEVKEPGDFDAAFGAMIKAGASALLALQDPVFAEHASRMVQLAGRHRLPAMWGNRLWVEAGGLMTYGLVSEDLWRRAASYVDRILKGAKPGDLPIEQPNKFDLVINMRTAKALGLTIPQAILTRADQLIE